MTIRLFLAFCLVTSFNASFGQTNVTLHMQQSMGGAPFALNQELSDTMGNYFTFTRLEYYISEVSLIHDGGQVTPATSLYLLVNPAVQSDFPIGSFPVTHLEGIQFSIGVDSAHNHSDPATYPLGHPLALRDPSMHWGWASGYRFVAFEGTSGFNSGILPDVFQIHTIGDQNYKTVSFPLDLNASGNQLTIGLEADYLHLLDSIRFWGGVISHSTSGRAADLINNLATVVFTVSETTGIIDPAVSGTIGIQPNPVNGFGQLNYAFAEQKHLQLSIVDINGRILHTAPLPGSEGSVLLPDQLPSGMYVALIRNEQHIIATERFIVQ